MNGFKVIGIGFLKLKTCLEINPKVMSSSLSSGTYKNPKSNGSLVVCDILVVLGKTKGINFIRRSYI